MNDKPIPSYDGSTVLADIPNGTVLKVSGAAYYKGLHCSTGQWGKTSYHGHEGYVPLNLMVRLLQ